MKRRLALFKRLSFIIYIVALSLVFIYYGLITYGIGQGIGQFHILWNTQKVSEYKKSNTRTKEELAKLHLIEEIKQYAIDSLHLNGENNYNTIYDQKGKPILWVVGASKPYELKSLDWNYGFLGAMSYRGFFKKENAIRLFKKLKNKGYDVIANEVSAWSTLGWFRDPILTSMFKRNEGSLASLIIHELTHSTVWIKGNITYNENMADFIGNKGAIMFLEHKFGKGSKEYIAYENSKVDNEKFYKYILKSAEGLDSLYARLDPLLYKGWFLTQLQKKAERITVKGNSLNTTLRQHTDYFRKLCSHSLKQLNENLNKYKFDYSMSEKEELKQKYLKKIQENIDTVSFSTKDNYIDFFKKSKLNNGFFMGFRKYKEKQNIFEEECQRKFKGDIRQYINYLKEKY